MAAAAAPSRPRRLVWLSPAEAAALFGMKGRAMRRLDGQLTVQRTPGGHRRYLESECSALAAALRRPGSALAEVT